MPITCREARSQMSDLCSGRAIGSTDATVDDQPPADSRANGYIERRANFATGSITGFGKGSDVAVIPQSRGDTQFTFRPGNEWKSIPTVHLVTCLHNPLRSEHWTAEAIANAFDGMVTHQPAPDIENLRLNPYGTALTVDVAADKVHKRLPITGTDAELQFCAADFDSEIHGWEDLQFHAVEVGIKNLGGFQPESRSRFREDET